MWLNARTLVKPSVNPDGPITVSGDIHGGVEMASGSVVLVVLVGVPLVFGWLVGYGFSERKFSARARRQTAAQTSIYRQLHELQAARQRGRPTSARKDYSARVNVGSFS